MSKKISFRPDVDALSFDINEKVIETDYDFPELNVKTANEIELEQ